MNEQIHRAMAIEEIFSSFPHKSQRLAQEITNAGLCFIAVRSVKGKGTRTTSPLS